MEGSNSLSQGHGIDNFLILLLHLTNQIFIDFFLLDDT